MREEYEMRVEVVFDIVVTKDGDDFDVYCPKLRGMHATGKTEEEAIKNARLIIWKYIESLIKYAEDCP